MNKIKYDAGTYILDFKDGSRHYIDLTANEAKVMYQKFFWYKAFNLKEINFHSK